MENETQLASFAVKSYRYLRLSIVVLAAAILVSVQFERMNTTCYLSSVSAYYYSPVQSVFVGGLVAIGVILIAIRGNTDAEDVLLNLAGGLAVIVAFVPTTPPNSDCRSVGVTLEDGEAFIDNNVISLAIGLALALLVGGVVASMRSERNDAEDEEQSDDAGDGGNGGRTVWGIPGWSVVGLVIGAAMVFIGVAWYFLFRETFLEYAHTGAAVTMFVLIGVVMVLNARGAAGPYGRLYATTAIVMVVSAIAVFVGKFVVDPDWGHYLLWLELLELAAFAAYWIVQTVELWNVGVPTGDDRDDRTMKSTSIASGATPAPTAPTT